MVSSVITYRCRYNIFIPLLTIVLAKLCVPSLPKMSGSFLKSLSLMSGLNLNICTNCQFGRLPVTSSHGNFATVIRHVVTSPHFYTPKQDFKFPVVAKNFYRALSVKFIKVTTPKQDFKFPVVAKNFIGLFQLNLLR